MKRCPTCGATIESRCSACGQPIKTWRREGMNTQWVHSNEGDWVFCAGVGEPKPKPVTA